MKKVNTHITTDINETIEAWLFDDEDYPACNRLVRRFAKRTSKRKLYRKCKEKHKTWERYRNRIMEATEIKCISF
jgi:hypothetical protein